MRARREKARLAWLLACWGVTLGASALHARPKVSAPRTPALDAHVRRGPVDMSNVYIYSRLHGLGTTGKLFRLWNQHCHLRPSRAREHNKQHSYCASVTNEMRQDGYDWRKPAYGNIGNLDVEIRPIVRSVVHKLRSDPKAEVVVLDEDGLLHAALAKALRGAPATMLARIRGTQHTASGTKLLKRIDVPYPVVDYGQFEGKLTYESPSIALSSVKTVHRELEQLAQRGLSQFDVTKRPVKVMVVGDGATGHRTALRMKKLGYDVSVLDYAFADNAKRVQRARAAGLKPLWTDFRVEDEVARYKAAKKAGHEGDALDASLNVMFGRTFDIPRVLRKMPKSEQPKVYLMATGSPVLWKTGHLPHGSVVFNLASSARDIPRILTKRWVIRPGQPFLKKRIQPGADSENLFRAHRVYRSALRREVLYAFGGQVANFGGPDPIPPCVIQYTRGLTHSAVEQVMKCKPGERGVRPLANCNALDLLRQETERDVKAAGCGSLLEPKF